MIKNNFDIVIIGGGMVGLAIAYQIIERGFLKDILICITSLVSIISL